MSSNLSPPTLVRTIATTAESVSVPMDVVIPAASVSAPGNGTVSPPMSADPKTDMLLRAAVSRLQPLLTQMFPMSTLVSSGSIPAMVMRCMIVAREYVNLSGEQKKLVVVTAVTEWIQNQDAISPDEKPLLLALLPSFLPYLVDANYYIDQTAQKLFSQAKAKCSSMSCFKAQ
jgi:hypothetical protein